ncbi:hypothetical protein EZ449_09910 [Pedobacter frigidisoli]|uniref:Uncharacterized protein n=1 Tax=Pedobacter frigidisoli TaxID=2530455 RepID=A0A4R0P3D7_9SPHI|nr:hypothetical protein [Pedobacter frigidisoli]TCD10133.1 hypothetical protein EZ449_09910 [Pedobacter frigidisoli]
MDMNDNSGDQVNPDQLDGIEWDNDDATYGHKLPEIKRKDLPTDEHLEKIKNQLQVNDDLVNSNLSQGEDIGNRNKEKDKGIRGKDL